MLADTQNRKVCNPLGEKMKFTNEMMEQVYAIFGDCQIEFDNDGQIIIYTGMYDNPGPGDGNEEEEESV